MASSGKTSRGKTPKRPGTSLHRAAGNTTTRGVKPRPAREAQQAQSTPGPRPAARGQFTASSLNTIEMAESTPIEELEPEGGARPPDARTLAAEDDLLEEEAPIRRPAAGAELGEIPFGYT